MIVIDGDDGDVTSTGNTGGKAYLYLRTAVIMIDCGRILNMMQLSLTKFTFPIHCSHRFTVHGAVHRARARARATCD